jgi:hypothetical protein
MIWLESSRARSTIAAGEATISCSCSREGGSADDESCGTSLAKAATSSSSAVVAWVIATSG